MKIRITLTAIMISCLFVSTVEAKNTFRQAMARKVQSVKKAVHRYGVLAKLVKNAAKQPKMDARILRSNYFHRSKEGTEVKATAMGIEVTQRVARYGYRSTYHGGQWTSSEAVDGPGGRYKETTRQVKAGPLMWARLLFAVKPGDVNFIEPVKEQTIVPKAAW
ncbi:MAG: hypothetical protein JRH20_21235 [Deltaproteobacteria bacterium]|nr:hypothetical protein [Deltaproteobacteria bacterium]